MKIEVWRYRLKARQLLNARTEAVEVDGALVRGDGGVGCLHPWPSLGDAALEEQLKKLAAGESTPLIQEALRCLKEDASARREGRSLFDQPIPRSQWLVLLGDRPDEVREQGFDTVKLKLGRDIAQESEEIALWADAGFRIRLDANESLSLATFLEFWESLGGIRNRVELVEDPTAWDAESYRVLREVRVPVAVDRDMESRLQEGEMAVVKPALSGSLPPGSPSFLVTSYMDHAIGQCWAAYRAMKWSQGTERGKLLTCGLLTHRCFEDDAFFERLEVEETRLQPPVGTGLGFDDLLEELPWERLN